MDVFIGSLNISRLIVILICFPGSNGSFNEIKTIIDQYQNEGWNLYKCDVMYVNAGGSIGPITSSGFYHHLIFEKEKVA